MVHALVLILIANLVHLPVQPIFAQNTMPTPESVGPQAMAAEIAPIKAPFLMPEMTRPDFSNRVIHVNTRLLVDKQATAALQSAIDQASAAGGGTVVVPAGKWQTGRLILKSGVNLHLKKGAVLRFSGATEDYMPPVFTRYEGIEIMGLGGLIYAHNQERIAVTGVGELHGPPAGPVREARGGISDQIIDSASPVDERVLDGREGRHYLRPNFICLVGCRDVLIEGVKLRNGPMWNVVPIYCDGVVIRGVAVDSRGVVNGDGIDIDSSRNVLIEYCWMSTGDDCYAVKAGRDQDGLRVCKPAENIVIRHCYAIGGFGGFTCGSETAGGIRNIHVHDCLFENVHHAAYFKTRRPRGGGGEHILVERIAFTSVSHAVFFDMIGSPLYVGDLGNRLPARPLNPATPYYRDITIRDIRGESTDGEAFKIKGIPESPPAELTLEQANIRSRDLVNLTDAAGVTIANCRLAPRHPVFRLLDSREVRVDNTEFVSPGGKPIELELLDNGVDSVRFEGCNPPSKRSRSSWESAQATPRQPFSEGSDARNQLDWPMPAAPLPSTTNALPYLSDWPLLL